MKTIVSVLGLASLIALAACDSKQENKVENAYENQADAIDNQASNMEAMADNLSGNAERAAENAADALENKAEATREAVNALPMPSKRRRSAKLSLSQAGKGVAMMIAAPFLLAVQRL